MVIYTTYTLTTSCLSCYETENGHSPWRMLQEMDEVKVYLSVLMRSRVLQIFSLYLIIISSRTHINKLEKQNN